MYVNDLDHDLSDAVVVQHKGTCTGENVHESLRSTALRPSNAGSQGERDHAVSDQGAAAGGAGERQGRHVLHPHRRGGDDVLRDRGAQDPTQR